MDQIWPRLWHYSVLSSNFWQLDCLVCTNAKQSSSLHSSRVYKLRSIWNIFRDADVWRSTWVTFNLKVHFGLPAGCSHGSISSSCQQCGPALWSLKQNLSLHSRPWIFSQPGQEIQHSDLYFAFDPKLPGHLPTDLAFCHSYQTCAPSIWSANWTVTSTASSSHQAPILALPRTLQWISFEVWHVPAQIFPNVLGWVSPWALCIIPSVIFDLLLLLMICWLQLQGV